MFYNMFIPSSVDEHLGYFFLAIMSMLLWTFMCKLFCRHILSGLLGEMNSIAKPWSNYMFSILRNYQTVLQNICTILYFHISSVWGFQILYIFVHDYNCELMMLSMVLHAHLKVLHSNKVIFMLGGYHYHRSSCLQELFQAFT